ncbi:hypothetical protein GCM10010166_12910 [Couchioplanes caeruleus subsp. azureus]|nr:hypothetical protein GCM10010166_12910 [Couchioplanes caeruleus subsp. azureus]
MAGAVAHRGAAPRHDTGDGTGRGIGAEQGRGQGRRQSTGSEKRGAVATAVPWCTCGKSQGA